MGASLATRMVHRGFVADANVWATFGGTQCALITFWKLNWPLMGEGAILSCILHTLLVAI